MEKKVNAISTTTTRRAGTVGEVRRLWQPGRREIGHATLRERALTAVLPDEVEVPVQSFAPLQKL